MHIAFVITRGDAVGGATIHVRDMALRLRKEGMRATVLIGGHGEAASELGNNGIPLRIIRHLRREISPAHDALALRQLVREIRLLRPDLVSTHTAKAGWLGRAASRIAGVPAMFTPHGWSISDRISSSKGRVFRVAERLAAPLAHTIVNVCEAERDIATRHDIAPYSKLAVVHNGVRDIPRSLLADPGQDPPRLAMVARFEEPKDHASLLHALATLRSYPWQLDLIGGGPKEQEIRALSAQLGLADQVHFLGSGTVVAEHLSRSQVFILTSRSEGFPRSILEAMRAGLPVVATGVGGVGEAVQHGETGFVVPRKDPRALAECLRMLITNRDLRRRFGQAGRVRYAAHFTFETMFAKNVALYNDIVRRTSAVFAETKGVYGVQ